MESPQRESYQLPSQRESGAGAQQQQEEQQPQQQQQQQQPSSIGYTPSYGGGGGGLGLAEQAPPSVIYNCGECGCKVSLNFGDAIRCKECGHRVLYKERTKR